MRLTGCLLQITPDELRALQARPKLVRALIFGKQELDTAKLITMSERIQEIAMRAENSESAADPDELEKARAEILSQIQSAEVRVPDEDPREAGLCLEKTWHILHYLITGKAGEAAGAADADDVSGPEHRFAAL